MHRNNSSPAFITITCLDGAGSNTLQAFTSQATINTFKTFFEKELLSFSKSLQDESFHINAKKHIYGSNAFENASLCVTAYSMWLFSV